MVKLKITVDWDGQNYSPLNGFHPLFKILLLPNDYLEFIIHEYRNKLIQYKNWDHLFKNKLSIIRNENKNNKIFEIIWNYFDLDEQFLTEMNTYDAYLCHTFPLSLKYKKFIFHIEDIKSLYLPFCDYHNISISEIYNNKYINEYNDYLFETLADDKCICILCHYDETIDELCKLFGQSINAKIKKINIYELHKELFDTNNIDVKKFESDKNRIIFTHSFHGNTANLNERGLDLFIEIADEFKNENNIIPTLILPKDFNYSLPKLPNNIQVFSGYLKEDLYNNLLKEAKYHFLYSDYVHTKVAIDCILYDIKLIAKIGEPYKQLGINKENSINICGTIKNQLSLDKVEYTNSLEKFNIVNEIIASNNKKLTKENNIKNKNNKFNKINKISKFNELAFFIYKKISFEEKISDVPTILNKLEKNYFEISTRYLLFLDYNDVYILTNRKYYIYSRMRSLPKSIKINDFYSSNNFYIDNDGILLFEDLMNIKNVYNIFIENKNLEIEKIKKILIKVPLLFILCRFIFKKINIIISFINRRFS